MNFLTLTQQKQTLCPRCDNAFWLKKNSPNSGVKRGEGLYSPGCIIYLIHIPQACQRETHQAPRQTVFFPTQCPKSATEHNAHHQTLYLAIHRQSSMLTSLPVRHRIESEVQPKITAVGTPTAKVQVSATV
ncbi:hypothetical protein SLA2020_451430 [Shorea laevis]